MNRISPRGKNYAVLPAWVIGTLGMLVTGCELGSVEQKNEFEASGQDNPYMGVIESYLPPLLESREAAAAEELQGEDLEAFLKTSISKEVSFVPEAEPMAPIGKPMAKTAATECNIDFNSSNSLSWIGNTPQAWNTFTFWPYYIADCGSLNGWAYVVPQVHNHYHLGHESPNVCLGTVPGKVGVMSNGKCVQTNIEAKYSSRNISPHWTDEFVRFYVNNKSTKSRVTFNLKSIRVPPVAKDANKRHIRVRVRKANGSWLHWASLAPGTTWNFPQTGTGGAQGITEIQITTPTGHYGWTVDDVIIGPYYGG